MKITKISIKKVIALIVALILITGLLLFSNALVGNPISKMIAKKGTENYIEANYSDLNLEIEKFFYSFKDSKYHALCQATDSIDTVFSITVDGTGNVINDSYESEVVERFSTYRRLSDEIRVIGEEILREHLDYEISNANFLLGKPDPDITKKLIPNMELDFETITLPIEVYISIVDSDISYEKMAEVLVAMAKVLEEHNIPIETYSIRVEYDKLENVQDGAEARENVFISIYDIPNEILESDDIPNALEELDINVSK